MTQLELYNKAKEAYYNGEAIMTDYEFDELEKSLGLENKSYVGAKHNPTYTIEHPFKMGSLSKIQVHKEKDGSIDFAKYASQLSRFLSFPAIITPKYDGCSFEAVVDGHNVKTISSRGDGEFGKDYYKHLYNKVYDAIKMVLLNNDRKLVFRGEVLINKNLFEQKYSNFTNPRSFVSGVLNSDYNDSIKEQCNDLSIVIYDTRILNEDGTYNDVDWTEFADRIATGCSPEFYEIEKNWSDPKVFQKIYEDFTKVRETNEYALDGIVFKTIAMWRKNEPEAFRPSDCVAIKFVPMLEETEVVDIEWNLGKSGEWIPCIITKPVMMDGKSVSRAKANNLGYLLDKKISIGTKVVLSLAGDIIPFIYKITNVEKFDSNKLCLPESKTEINGCHLMSVMTDDEKKIEQLRNSLAVLNLDGMGGTGIDKVVEYVKATFKKDAFFDEDVEIPTSAFQLSESVFEGAIGGKTATKIIKSFKETIKNLDLKLLIRSCNFRLCGEKVAEQIQNMLLGIDYNFSSMAKEAYEWSMDKNSDEYKYFESLLKTVGYSIDYFKDKHIKTVSESSNEERIPVILTGEPNNYSTKGEFLKLNPQYRMTSSWKEVKIVFTNSFDSTTGKMKKAKQLGIDIQLY
jgi:NAD-dependent DNA ligase